MTDDVSRRCVAITKAGSRCTRHDTGDDALCLVHSPARRDEFEAIRRRGLAAARGAQRAARASLRAPAITEPTAPCPPLVRSLEGVTRFLAWIAVQVASGTMHPKQGSTATYAASTLRTALVARDLELQLKAARAELRTFQAAQRKAPR